MKTLWILRSEIETDDETEAPLFWTHDFGWGPRDQATVYDKPVPIIEGVWVRA